MNMKNVEWKDGKVWVGFEPEEFLGLLFSMKPEDKPKRKPRTKPKKRRNHIPWKGMLGKSLWEFVKQRKKSGYSNSTIEGELIGCASAYGKRLSKKRARVAVQKYAYAYKIGKGDTNATGGSR